MSNEDRTRAEFVNKLSSREFIDSVTESIKKNTPNLNLVGSNKQKEGFVLGIFAVVAAFSLKSYDEATASKQQDIDALTLQVLELSAQVGVMKKSVSFAVEDLLLRAGLAGEDCLDISQSALDGLNAIASLEPSAALRAHVDEEVAKALEEAAMWFEEQEYRETSWSSSRAAAEIMEMRDERRNGK